MATVASARHQLGELFPLIGREDRRHLPERARAHLDDLGGQPLDVVLLGLDGFIVGAGQRQVTKLGLSLPKVLALLALGVGVSLIDLTNRLELLVAEPELLLELARPSRWW